MCTFIPYSLFLISAYNRSMSETDIIQQKIWFADQFSYSLFSYFLKLLALSENLTDQVFSTWKIFFSLSSSSHYSKSQIFVQKFNFDKTLQFFSGNQSCQQLKSSKLKHFHEFFTQKIDNFSGNQSWIFGQKMKISNSFCVIFAYYAYYAC